VEVDIVERVDTAAELDIVDCFETAEDIAAVDFHNSIDSFQYFVHIRKYWCSVVESFLHHASVHLLDHWTSHVLHALLCHLYLLDC
jgi:hypothetical protein